MTRMTTITDTSVLHWLPFDDIRDELWKLALINTEKQNWNSTDLNNSTKILEKMAASKHGMNLSLMCSPAQLGLATGLLLSLLINSRIWTTKANREGFGRKILLGDPKPYQWILHLTPSSSFTFASTKTFILHYLYLLPLLALLLLLPLLLAFLALLLPFVAYRLAVHAYLERWAGNRAKLFSGADAVWMFNESHESYSVINALLLLHGRPDILKLRQIFRDRLGAFPKLRMRRGFTLGYATWYEDHALDLGSLVRWLPGDWGNTDDAVGGRSAGELRQSECEDKGDRPRGEWNRKNLCAMVEQRCNLPLPDEHSAGWEARVGRAMPWSEDDRGAERGSAEDEGPAATTVFPILFRIHHSIGDGASLLQLLMSALIDNDPPAATTNDRRRSAGNSSAAPAGSAGEARHALLHAEAESGDDFFKRPECGEEFDEGHGDPQNVAADESTISKSGTERYSAKRNERKEERESSFLYGRRLSGRKIILWDSNSVTVEEIKKIRTATGVKFTEILLSAVSAALSSYWEARRNGALSDDLEATDALSTKLQNMEEQENPKATEEESERRRDKMEGVQNVEDALNNAKTENPPSSVKLVVPAILGSLFQRPKGTTINGCNGLENLFSVAVMTLPIGESGGCSLRRLSKVSDASGCMMPLRKDSVIDYKSKVNHEMLIKNADASKSSHSSPVVKEPKRLESREPRDFQFSSVAKSWTALNSENENAKINGEDSEKTAMISPHRSEVLTYYYTTKKSETVLKLNPQTFLTLKKNSTVQYHKKADSAKLIIHNKEPYGCPTTIFFTHSNQSDINSHLYKDSSSKRFLQTQEMSAKDEYAEEPLDGDGDSDKSSVAEASDDLKPEARHEPAAKADEKSVPETAPALQGRPATATPQPIPSIQFPSSPTIQHLLMRWLALDIVATIIPSFIATPLMSFASNGVAVVMSNLPGPPKRLHSILGGHSMKDIVFWAPHRGFTGLGVTVISYDGKLQIGLMADDAVVPTQKGAQHILNAILDELHCLEAAVSITY